MLPGMRPPIFVRPLTDLERAQLDAGLRSTDAFVLRRCQIILASARHERAPAIAVALGCSDQTVRDTIRAFEEQELATFLTRSSSRPKRLRTKLDPANAERLTTLLHTSPRSFGKPTSIWTLDLAAEVAFAQGLTTELVSGETIRMTLRRLGLRWTRAKHWITSPDPEYAQKNGDATG